MVYNTLNGFSGVERLECAVVASGVYAVAEKDVNQIVLFVDPEACACKSGVPNSGLRGGFAARRKIRMLGIGTVEA